MILNAIHNALGGIHAEDELKTRTKAAVAAAVESKKRARRRMTAAVSSAACAVIFSAAAIGWNIYYTPVYALGIDINPSLELGINRFDRVVSVTGYNEDGIALAESADIKNMSYTDAVDTLLNSDAVKEYTDGGADVVVTVNGGSESKTGEMVTAVESCHSASGMHCYGMSSEDADEARSLGLSMGKYGAYLELKKYDPDITADEVASMTMRDLRERIKSYSGEDYYPGGGQGAADGECAGDGAGARNGNGAGAQNGSGHHHGRHSE